MVPLEQPPAPGLPSRGYLFSPLPLPSWPRPSPRLSHRMAYGAWPALARRREGEHGRVNHLVDGVERLMPKLPELAEFVRTIPDLAPSQCFSALQRFGSRTTSSIRSWLCERTTRTARGRSCGLMTSSAGAWDDDEVRGVEASDDSFAGSKVLAKLVRKRTLASRQPGSRVGERITRMPGVRPLQPR